MLNQYLELAGTLAGAAALFAAVINALKAFGVIQDSQAWIVSVVLNFGLLGLVIIAQAYGLNLARFDSIAASAASLLTILVSLFGQLIVSRVVHAGLKRAGVPVLGHSFSR